MYMFSRTGICNLQKYNNHRSHFFMHHTYLGKLKHVFSQTVVDKRKTHLTCFLRFCDLRATPFSSTSSNAILNPLTMLFFDTFSDSHRTFTIQLDCFYLILVYIERKKSSWGLKTMFILSITTL